MAELVTHEFNITRRRQLGRALDIPVKFLETVELAVSGKNEKRLALTRIISYWVDKNKESSLEELADVLEIKMKMNPIHADRIRMLIGDTYLKRHDIEPILDALKDQSLPDADKLAKEFNVVLCLHCSSETEEVTRLYWTLKTWIDRSLGRVTWNKLIHHMTKVDKEAALKIKALITGRSCAQAQYRQSSQIDSIV